MNYSKQRELILQAVTGACTHPTAETVYGELKTEHPRLSLATVYRNLNQLCEAGQLRRLRLPDSPDRYDGDLAPHCHLYCRRCGSVVDLAEPDIDWSAALAQNAAHRVDGWELICYGECGRCRMSQLPS